MKIFATGFSDLSGEKSTPGGMVHLLEVCRNIQALGNELTLFVSSPEPYPNALPFRIVYLPYVKIRFVTSLLQPVFLFCYLLYFGIREKCDLIYENTVAYSITGALAAKILNVPHCMHVHGFYTDEMEMGGHGKFRILVVKIVEKINYMLSDALFCVTPVVKEKICELYKIRDGVAHFVYNGVDADRCRPTPKADAASQLGLSPDDLYVGFIGYLFPWSGIEKLIAVAPIIVREVPNVKFLIVGHGLWGDKLPGMAEEAGVRDRFIFAGYQPWAKVPVYCNIFDVGVTPYPGAKGVGRYRSSMKSLEYSSAGKPVVITKCEGVSDIIENAKCGLVVEPDNNDALADAIIRLLKDKKLRDELGQNGRKLIEENYTWRHVASKMLDIVKRIPARR